LTSMPSGPVWHAYDPGQATGTTEAQMSTPIAVMTGPDGIEVKVFATKLDNGLAEFTIQSAGPLDINGFFVDLGDDGGIVRSVGSKANNMNGSAYDGTALDGWDHAVSLGSVGVVAADRTSATFTIPGLTYDSLFANGDGEASLAQVGIRATSVGADREGSLKLQAIVEPPPAEPPPGPFQDIQKGISNVVFYFDTPDDYVGDTRPSARNGGPDGYFTVKVDFPGEPEITDLDQVYANMLATLTAEYGSDVTGALVGVHIKTGSYGQDGPPDLGPGHEWMPAETTWYVDLNGGAPDPAPVFNNGVDAGLAWSDGWLMA